MAPHIIDRRPFDKGDVLNRILVTRPEPGATQTAERLTALGFLPVLAPVLEIMPRTYPPPGHVVATLLTSRNAVASCPGTLYERPVFTVGTATATLAATVGFRRIYNADGDSLALSALVAATLSPARGSLFLPTAKGQGISLAGSLRRQGFRVIRRVAYQTVGVSVLPAAAATGLRQGQVTGAMFFSGETARHFVHLVQAAELAESLCNVDAVSISARVAVALRPLPWRRISVAASPTQDAMLALLT